jgi:hypothetical protein
MRCDLHIHSIASGRCTTPLLDRVSKESYNLPAQVYARCKELGMSIVTLTDHDSIDAAETLRCHPDFFVSEEVTCQMPSGTQVHIGVYNLSERDHLELQRRRKDFVSLVMYLTEQKLFFSVNHVFSGLTGRREAEDFHWLASYVPAFETRNGQMSTEANRQALALAPEARKDWDWGKRFAHDEGRWPYPHGSQGSEEHLRILCGPACKARPRSRRERELRRPDRGRLPDHSRRVPGKACDAGFAATDRPGAGLYGWTLDERTMVLQEVGGALCKCRRSPAHAVGPGPRSRTSLRLVLGGS